MCTSTFRYSLKKISKSPVEWDIIGVYNWVIDTDRSLRKPPINCPRKVSSNPLVYTSLLLNNNCMIQVQQTEQIYDNCVGCSKITTTSTPSMNFQTFFEDHIGLSTSRLICSNLNLQCTFTVQKPSMRCAAISLCICSVFGFVKHVLYGYELLYSSKCSAAMEPRLRPLCWLWSWPEETIQV